MKKYISIFIVFALLWGLSATPVMAQSNKKPTKEQLAKQKEKEKAAKEKEKQKAQAAKEKEKQKAQAAKDKEKAKAAKDKEKQQAAKDKQKAQLQAEKERALVEKERALAEKEKQQAAAEAKAERQLQRDAKPFEGHNYFNLSLRAGYAAMMDHTEQWQTTLLDNKLIGGPGAGLQLSYELEYKHFLFETGLDVNLLNSTSRYATTISRQDNQYEATYNYMLDALKENRTAAYVDLPLMVGAQFSDIYFLVGARVGYGLMSSYHQTGLYDITVYDPELLNPYGLGTFALDQKGSFAIKQPDVRLCAELGLDLDRWLQADPDPKKKKAKPGERQQFGKEYIHYRLGFFAEYGMLNSNAEKPAADNELFVFDPAKAELSSTHTMLGLGSKMNNLFVGARFTIQFEVPGKAAVPVPAYAEFVAVDSETGEVLPNVLLNVTNTQNNRVILRDKVLKNGMLKKTKMQPNDYMLSLSKEYYEPVLMPFRVDSAQTTSMTVQMRHKPYFYVTVKDAESGKVLPVNVVVMKNGTDIALHNLETDSVEGTTRQMLSDTILYSIQINHIGYEPYLALVPSVSEHMYVQLTPIKKGEVFIMKNLFFATNKTRILSTSEQALQDLSEYLMRNPDIRIKIIGHTDNVGKDQANQKLSEGRAQAVREDLIKRGVAAERLEVEGRGESQPIDTNETEEGRQNNRRVEVEIL